MSQDQRLWPANARVAHTSLQGQVAQPLVAGETYRVVVPVLGLYCAPDARQLDRQMVLGQAFCVLEIHDGQAFGFMPAPDGRPSYVGYAAAHGLAQGGPAPTHRVAAIRSLAFAGPSIKTPDPVPLPFGAQVAVTAEEGALMQIATGQFVPKAHLAPLAQPALSPVAVAQLFLGTPYLWGGNSAFGIDCSGLVHAAFQACGRPCPQDSDQQRQHLAGARLELGTPLCPGDLLFWRGHVAMACTPDMLIHANAWHMAVAYEQAITAQQRIAAQGDGPVLCHLRPS
jgi:cell wall-associated NlpC family hydrolase